MNLIDVHTHPRREKPFEQIAEVLRFAKKTEAA